MTKKYFWYPKQVKEDLSQLIEDYTSYSIDTFLDKFLYVIHLVTYKRWLMREEDYLQTGVRLYSNHLREILGTESSAIINLLLKWQYLSIATQYVPGESSRGYHLNPSSAALPVSRNVVMARKRNHFINRLIDKEREFYNGKITNYQLDIYTKLISLNEKGLNLLKQRYPHLSDLIDKYPNIPIDCTEYDVEIDSRDITLFSFLFKDYYAIRPEEGNRMYSNITSLHTPYRSLLEMDGKKIYNTDITNSQVLFGVFVIENYFKQRSGRKKLFTENSLPEDFKRFKQLSISGRIYEEVAEKAGMSQDILKDRKDFKGRFFRDVWYCKVSKKPNKIKTAFKELFPSVYEAINAIKENDYREFPIKLQKLEARMMLDTIGKQLMKDGIKFLTIHDSFVVNNIEDLEHIEELIRKEFSACYGAVPHFKRDDSEPQIAVFEEMDESKEELRHKLLDIIETFGRGTSYKNYDNSVYLPDLGITVDIKNQKVKYSGKKILYPLNLDKFKANLEAA